MPNSVFLMNQPEPSEEQLKHALGETSGLWDSFVGFLEGLYGELEYEWKIYGRLSGWQMVVMRGGEKILHMTPCKNQFAVWLALNSHDLREVKLSDLPRGIKEIVRNLKPHYGVWAHSYVVSNETELGHVKGLVGLRVNC